MKSAQNNTTEKPACYTTSTLLEMTWSGVFAEEFLEEAAERLAWTQGLSEWASIPAEEPDDPPAVSL